MGSGPLVLEQSPSSEAFVGKEEVGASIVTLGLDPGWIHGTCHEALCINGFVCVEDLDQISENV